MGQDSPGRSCCLCGQERRRFSGNRSGRNGSCPDLAQRLEVGAHVITSGRRHRWLASEGFSPSGANAEVWNFRAEAVGPSGRPLRDADAQELSALTTRRSRLMTMRVAEKNRLGRPAGAVRPSIEAHITRLEQGLDDLEKERRPTPGQRPLWRQKDDLLGSVPGAVSDSPGPCRRACRRWVRWIGSNSPRRESVAGPCLGAGHAPDLPAHRGTRLRDGGRALATSGWVFARRSGVSVRWWSGGAAVPAGDLCTGFLGLSECCEVVRGDDGTHGRFEEVGPVLH